MGEMTVVVGAGLAGLACARELARLGRPFVVLEAEGEPGGRVRSEKRDGFILDRGFQVVLSSYDAVDALVDREALCPRYFESGALLWHEGTFCHLANPLRHPVLLPQTLLAFPPGDSLRISALVAEVLVRQDADLLAGCGRPGDQSTRAFLEERGFGQSFLRRFAVPFFGGVLLDADLETSAALFRYYLKKFSLGRAFLPLEGMVGLPRLLAARLTGHRLRLGEEVSSIQVRSHRAESLKFADGTEIPVEAVVIASDAGSAGKLLGVNARQPLFRRVWQLAWTSPEPLTSARMLILPAGRRIVRHLTQITNVAPGYSPSGRPLLVASVLEGGTAGDAALAAAARREVCEIFPTCSDKLELVDIRRVDRAVIHQPPGFLAKKKTFDHPANIILAGDYLSTSSIESAMASGERAARRVLRCVESLHG